MERHFNNYQINNNKDMKGTTMSISEIRIHVRILMWHLQIGDNWEVKIVYNDYHKDLEHGWFKFHTFKPFKKI